MTDFLTLSYTSAIEIPTLSYTWSLKKGVAPGGGGVAIELLYCFIL